MPESAANSLEEQYFADRESFEQIWGVENDLKDAYVSGRLTPEEKGLFERHYLTSPLHREGLASARALQTAAARKASRPRAVPGPGWSLAAALLLSVTAGWLWRSLHVDKPQTAERPAPGAPSLPSPTPSPGRPVLRPTKILTFALSPTLVRGASPQPHLRVAPGTDAILLQLERDSGEASGEQGQRLTAEVRTVEGKSSWTGPAQAAGPGGGPHVLATVRLPAARLPPGDYILTLSIAEGGEEGTLHKYYFRVVP